MLPDAAGELPPGAGVQALEAAAGVLADAGLVPLLNAAAELSASLGMLAASSAATWGLPGATGNASAPLLAGACDAAVPAFAAAAAGQEDCTCSAVHPGMLSCTLMSLKTYSSTPLVSTAGVNCATTGCVWLQDVVSMPCLEWNRLMNYGTVEFILMICKVRS